VPGDEATQHWKSTAKTGSYMVRQYERHGASHLLVALSLVDFDYATAEEFELAVSATRFPRCPRHPRFAATLSVVERGDARVRETHGSRRAPHQHDQPRQAPR